MKLIKTANTKKIVLRITNLFEINIFSLAPKYQIKEQPNLIGLQYVLPVYNLGPVSRKFLFLF